MKRWIGRWLIGIGIVHTAVGLMVFSKPLLAILSDGVWNAVDGHAGRPLAFWFMVVGVLTLITGAMTDWIEARNNGFPAALGWGLLVLTILAVITMPISGAWLFIPPTLGALLRNRRVGQDQPIT